MVLSLKQYTEENITGSSTTEFPITESPVELDDEIKFLIIPLAVIVIIMLLSALVYLMAKRRRQELLRENILSLYDFDANEEWDSFNSYDHPSYNSTDFTTAF